MEQWSVPVVYLVIWQQNLLHSGDTNSL